MKEIKSQLNIQITGSVLEQARFHYSGQLSKMIEDFLREKLSLKAKEEEDILSELNETKTKILSLVQTDREKVALQSISYNIKRKLRREGFIPDTLERKTSFWRNVLNEFVEWKKGKESTPEPPKEKGE